MDYKAKANDSFKTKWSLFCFNSLIHPSKEFSLKSFQDFKILPELVSIYVNQYHQYEKEELLDDSEWEVSELMKAMESQLENSLKTTCQEDYVADFDKMFPKEQFEALGKDESCYYCELTLSDFDELYNHHLINKKANRGFVLELDRKTPNLEYTPDNCVMSCYWCNNAKTDEFDTEEFKVIGLVMGTTFKARLEKRKVNQ